MKKFFSVSVAILMLTLCIIPFGANAQSMEISTETDVVDYEVSFPADIEIPWASQSTLIGEVKAVKMLIEPNKMVKVSVSSQNGYSLVNVGDETKKLDYELIVSDISFKPGDYGKSYPLTVQIGEDAWQQATSGKHSDILTFTAEYTDLV